MALARISEVDDLLAARTVERRDAAATAARRGRIAACRSGYGVRLRPCGVVGLVLDESSSSVSGGGLPSIDREFALLHPGVAHECIRVVGALERRIERQQLRARMHDVERTLAPRRSHGIST